MTDTSKKELMNESSDVNLDILDGWTIEIEANDNLDILDGWTVEIEANDANLDILRAMNDRI